MDKNKYLDLQGNLMQEVTKTQAVKQLDINPQQDDRCKHADEGYSQWGFTYREITQASRASTEPRKRGLLFPILQKKKKYQTNRIEPIYPQLGEPGGLDDPLRYGLSEYAERWYLRFLMQGLSPEKARKKALERANETEQAPTIHSSNSHENSVDKNKNLDLQERSQCATQSDKLLERNLQREDWSQLNDHTPTQANSEREYVYENSVKYSGTMSELRDNRMFQNPPKNKEWTSTGTSLFRSGLTGHQGGTNDSLKSGLCGTGESKPFNDPSCENFIDKNSYRDWQVRQAQNMNITQDARQLKMNLRDCIGNPDKQWQAADKKADQNNIQANPQWRFLQRERFNESGPTADSINKELDQYPLNNEEWIPLNYPPLGQLKSKDDPLRIGVNLTGDKNKALESKLQYKQQKALERIEKKRLKKIALFKEVIQLRTSEAGKFQKVAEVCSDQASTVKVAIVHKDHPGNQLSADDLAGLKAAIIKITKGSKRKLKFIHIRSGFVVVDCIGEETADWIRSAVPRLREWRGPALVICPVDQT